jgi:hypothetical protein
MEPAMSRDSAQAFCDELDLHGDLYAEVMSLVRATSDVYLIDAGRVAELAAGKGFTFSARELCAAWAERHARKPDGELSDADLESVAGGARQPQVSFTLFQPDGTPVR